MLFSSLDQSRIVRLPPFAILLGAAALLMSAYSAPVCAQHLASSPSKVAASETSSANSAPSILKILSVPLDSTSTAPPDSTAPAPDVCPVGCAPIPDESPYNHTPPPRSSLAPWAHSRRLMVLDRKQSYGDRTFDRGVFRHVTPNMDREYWLDMMVYQYSPFEHARWMQAGGGIRFRTGSIERDVFALKTTIRSTVPLDDDKKNYFSIEGVLQEDVQANRSWLEMSYAHRFSPQHAVGVRHTFSANKADLDLTPFYRYSSQKWGKAGVELTIQNLYNDFIYQYLGIDAEVLDVLRTYDRNPYLFEVHYSSPKRFDLGGELIVGWQPESRATFASQTTPSFQYREQERVHYVGAILEYRYDPVAVGLFFKRDASRLQRTSEGDSLSTNYRSRQTQQRIGAFVKGSWGSFRGEVYAFTGVYNDQQTGSAFDTSVLERSIDFDTEQSGLHSRLLYEPDGWPYLGVAYAAFRRDLGANPRALVNGWTFQYWDFGPSNYRAIGLIGYRFSRGSVVMGMGYDLDGDPLFFTERTRRFDNGFFRFTLTW